MLVSSLFEKLILGLSFESQNLPQTIGQINGFPCSGQEAGMHAWEGGWVYESLVLASLLILRQMPMARKGIRSLGSCEMCYKTSKDLLRKIFWVRK